jgi:uncharacterized protein YjdB
VQNVGWQDWVRDDAMSGTSGQSLRLEAIQIKLEGDVATKYDVYYRVHAENVGWLAWAKNEESAGTAGHSLRLEAIQICLMKKGFVPPFRFLGVTTTAGAPRMIDPGVISQGLTFNALMHIENIGDRTYAAANGATILGTSGESLRVEARTIEPQSWPQSGSIEYQTHIQNIGWQGYKNAGELSGTSGQSLRLEALRIRLTGAVAANYDVYYRTHIENIGWTGWARNGQSCGSAGYSYRMEAMQIVIVLKGQVAPGLNANYFFQG